MARMDSLETIIEESLKHTQFKTQFQEQKQPIHHHPGKPTFKFRNYILLSAFYAFLLTSELFWLSYQYVIHQQSTYLILAIILPFLTHILGIMHKEYFFSSHLLHSPVHHVQGYLKYMIIQVGLYTLMQGVLFSFSFGIIYSFHAVPVNPYIKYPLITIIFTLTVFIHDLFIHNVITYSMSFGTGFTAQLDKTSYNLRVIKESMLKSLSWVLIIALASSFSLVSVSRLQTPGALATIGFLSITLTLLAITMDYKQRKALLTEIPDLVLDNLPHTLLPLVEKNLENLATDFLLMDEDLIQETILDITEKNEYETDALEHELPSNQDPMRRTDTTSNLVNFVIETDNSGMLFDPKEKSVIKYSNAKAKPRSSLINSSNQSQFLYCPTCGMRNEDDYKFCYNCGSPLINSDTFRET